MALSLILIGATIFGYYMTLSRIPQEVVTMVIAMDLNRWVVVIGIVVAYFVISMFMDEIPLLLLTLLARRGLLCGGRRSRAGFDHRGVAVPLVGTQPPRTIAPGAGKPTTSS